MQASVVIPVPTASIWRPWRGGITPAGRCPASPGITGHSRHVVSVAELRVAAAPDDLPVPRHDDLWRLAAVPLSSPQEEAAAAGGGDDAGEAHVEEAPAVSLSRRQLRTLRSIEQDLACSDPRLNDFFLLFSGGFRGCDMPRVERVSRWPSRMLARLWGGRNVERVAAWYAGNWHDP